MLLITSLCSGCGRCMDVCPVGAILPPRQTGKVRIDPGLCVECGTCARTGVCPEPGALVRPKLRWPRIVRRSFSDPLTVHSGTDVPGRGTEEMKTNDVTGRFGPGEVGVSVDMGRPGLSTSFADIQRVAAACARAGARFESRNPLTSLMADGRRGTFVPGVMRERVLSAIIEVQIGGDRLTTLLEAVKRAADKVDTVLSVGICVPVETRDGWRTLRRRLQASGWSPLPNGKINVGLGRPRSVPSCREKK